MENVNLKMKNDTITFEMFEPQFSTLKFQL